MEYIFRDFFSRSGEGGVKRLLLISHSQSIDVLAAFFFLSFFLFFPPDTYSYDWERIEAYTAVALTEKQPYLWQPFVIQWLVIDCHSMIAVPTVTLTGVEVKDLQKALAEKQTEMPPNTTTVGKYTESWKLLVNLAGFDL